MILQNVKAGASRRGVTLMELLVVISIIGMLMALLLPAVQASREAARLNACKNNLHQIGIALLNHESALKRFPSGGWGYQWYGDPDRGSGLDQPGGWPFSVLPYIERRDMAAFGAGQTGNAKLQAVAQLNEMPVSLFYCPTRRAVGTYPFDMQWPPINAAPMAAAAKLDYAINGGDYKLTDQGAPKSYAQANDPKFVWPDSSKGDGVCYFHATVSLDQVRDGTSLTYLVGEKNVAFSGLDLGDDQSLFVGYDLDNTRWTTTAWPPVPDGAAPQFNQFGSSHPSGCQFVFCDGSVRVVSYGIDRETHRRLGNRQDGLVIVDVP
jgi:prepilin-type N-terminal cleavage/methylation domain-containing protein/prepilin-type processing-associated H-X9-DG protein